MKAKKQCGSDEIPAEFLQAICLPGSAAADWIMHLFETIWAKKQIPHEWHIARIAAIFKKGDASNCANYRPIALLNASYKLFASILLNRLRQAHVGDSLSPTQFGFRQGSCVSNALFMARRFIDRALATTW